MGDNNKCDKQNRPLNELKKVEKGYNNGNKKKKGTRDKDSSSKNHFKECKWYKTSKG